MRRRNKKAPRQRTGTQVPLSTIFCVIRGQKGFKFQTERTSTSDRRICSDEMDHLANSDDTKRCSLIRSALTG